jgi:hypothetical protein
MTSNILLMIDAFSFFATLPMIPFVACFREIFNITSQPKLHLVADSEGKL